jgi:hypothetical protein
MKIELTRFKDVTFFPFVHIEYDDLGTPEIWIDGTIHMTPQEAADLIRNLEDKLKELE